MSITLDKIVVGANESIFVSIQGSAERSILPSVSKSGRCFIAAPQNTERKTFELATNGMKEVAEEEQYSATR